MPAPIGIFLNKVRQFFPSDFEDFTTAFKTHYPKIKTAEADDKMVWGYFPGETTAEFKYDPEDYVLHTDLSQTQVYDFVRKAQK